jgi:hypothetical protein
MPCKANTPGWNVSGPSYNDCGLNGTHGKRAVANHNHERWTCRNFRQPCNKDFHLQTLDSQRSLNLPRVKSNVKNKAQRIGVVRQVRLRCSSYKQSSKSKSSSCLGSESFASMARQLPPEPFFVANIVLNWESTYTAFDPMRLQMIFLPLQARYGGSLFIRAKP